MKQNQHTSTQATDAQWDRAIELTLRRLVYGAGAGLALGLIFTRSSAGRGRAMSFGLGMGVGSAYTDASREFGGVVPPLPSVLQPTPK
mmetsp:Transcript_7907/g.18037  ORF Transcript_7907/g.18037 Transcript_7907/m.18037 type:complete len:88 (+) Transcript_7907:365-628(+)